jgi:hypothetical protein
MLPDAFELSHRDSGPVMEVKWFADGKHHQFQWPASHHVPLLLTSYAQWSEHHEAC